MIPLIPSGLEPPLRAYLDLLNRWNRIHALTALPVQSRREELVVDSCALLPHLVGLEPGGRVADLGTGMGIPAVVIALARPDLDIWAIDSSKKKLAFVRQAGLELGIRNLVTVEGRFQDLPPLEADLGVAKALGPIEALLAWWKPLGKPGSPFLALKGPESWADPRPAGWDYTEHSYDLPTRGGRYVLEARPCG